MFLVFWSSFLRKTFSHRRRQVFRRSSPKFTYPTHSQFFSRNFTSRFWSIRIGSCSLLIGVVVCACQTITCLFWHWLMKTFYKGTRTPPSIIREANSSPTPRGDTFFKQTLHLVWCSNWFFYECVTFCGPTSVVKHPFQTFGMANYWFRLFCTFLQVDFATVGQGF